MDREKKNQLIALAATLLLFLSLIGIGVLRHKNKGLEQSFNKEKLNSEKLLSEKMMLEKQISSLKGSIVTLEGKNHELDGFLAGLKAKLSDKEVAYNRLLKENNNLQVIKRQNNELKNLRNELIAQIENLKTDNANLSDKNNSLNQLVEQLKLENSQLLASLRAKENLATNLRIDVMKKRNDKLTVKSRQSKRLLVSFEVGAGSGKSAEDYRVDIVSPKGALVEGKIQTTEAENPGQLSASINAAPVMTDGKERMELVFVPNKKLEAGIYSMVIYNKNQLIGRAQFKLR